MAIFNGYVDIPRGYHLVGNGVVFTFTFSLGVAHVITDGLAGIENQMVPLLGLHHKTLGRDRFEMVGITISILHRFTLW